MFDYQFRIILIGDSMVGKSSLVRYFSEGKFSNMCDPTVGVDFFARLVELQNGVRIKLQLWDTAGQEKFRSITKSYYRNSVAALLVFDITQRRSFDHLAEWYEEARYSMKCPEPTFIVIGHKSDMDAERQVSSREARYFAQSLGGYDYVETSALTGNNVEKAFVSIAESVYELLLAGRFSELRETGAWDGVKEGYGPQPRVGVRLEEIGSGDEEDRGGLCCR